VTAARAWGPASNLLCVRLDTIGDVLMTTPALRALREAVPRRRVTLLTSSAGAAAAPLLDSVDDTIVYDAPWLKASPARPDPGADLAMVELLRAHRFDAAVIFTVYSQSPLPAALMCHLAGVPLRAAHCREKVYGLLTDRVPEPEPEQLVRHEVRRQLDLAAAVGATARDERMSVAIPPGARAQAARLLARAGVGERGWIAVHPGATAPSRRYPPEAYAAAVRGLVERGLQVVLTGTPDEVPLVEGIRAEAGSTTVSLAGLLDLPLLAAVIARAPLLLTNNTGPAHIAAALGTPVVDLYALTNPQHTPWMVPARVLSHDVECRWCYSSVCPLGHHDCLRLVSPTSVVEAVLDLLRETSASVTPAAHG
jgi:lipopolysaccharide heptosyltransferase II